MRQQKICVERCRGEYHASRATSLDACNDVLLCLVAVGVHRHLYATKKNVKQPFKLLDVADKLSSAASHAYRRCGLLLQTEWRGMCVGHDHNPCKNG